jgi:uncharacterized protein YpuA (DUF1002 family)
MATASSRQSPCRRRHSWRLRYLAGVYRAGELAKGAPVAQAVYEAAVRHLQTVQDVDALAEMHADRQLKLLQGRLQRLAFRATPPSTKEED